MNHEGLSKNIDRKYFITLSLFFIAITGLIVKLVFQSHNILPPFDPWRHLTLINNIQSGKGFTLFTQQLYIWHTPTWYYFAALVTLFIKLKTIVFFLSLINPVLLFLFVYKTQKSLFTAFIAGFIFSIFIPTVLISSSYGSESFSLTLILLSFLVFIYKPKDSLFLVLFSVLFSLGISCRVNFVFIIFLLIPFFKKKKQLFILATTVILFFILIFFRNYFIINSNSFIFTWDGLATKSSGYNLLSTLIPQLNNTVSNATSELYRSIFKYPEWLFHNDHISYGIICFFSISLIALFIAKKLNLYLSALIPILLFIFFDKTLSGYFLKNYLAIFPVFFIALAIAVNKSVHCLFKTNSNRILFSSITVLLIFICRLSFFVVKRPVNLESVTPPPNLIKNKYYLVNSGYFHPQSLIFKYPDKNFIGLPLNYADFKSFIKQYPKYKNIIWNVQFSVQDDLLIKLIETKQYKVQKYIANKIGLEYVLLTKNK